MLVSELLKAGKITEEEAGIIYDEFAASQDAAVENAVNAIYREPIEITDANGDVILYALHEYDPGSPGCNYMPNGDPGYPGEPGYSYWRLATPKEVIEILANGEVQS